MGKLVSITECAARLGMTQQTIRNWIKDGHIKVKTIGKATYIDEATINALQDTTEDIERSKKALLKLDNELRAEMQRILDERREESARKHYLNLMVGSALRSGFYKTMTHLLFAYGRLNEREAEILTRFLEGETLEFISGEYLLTRERVRQIVEKAIRKSQDLTNIEEQLNKMKTLQADKEALKKTVSELKEQLRKQEKYQEPTDVEKLEIESMCNMLSVKISESGLSVRARNCFLPIGDTIGDICRLRKTDLLKCRNTGKKTLLELECYLLERGLELGMDVDKIFAKRAEMLIYK